MGGLTPFEVRIERDQVWLCERGSPRLGLDSIEHLCEVSAKVGVRVYAPLRLEPAPPRAPTLRGEPHVKG